MTSLLLVRVFQYRYVYIRVLIGGYVTAQSTGSQRGIGGEIQIPET